MTGISESSLKQGAAGMVHFEPGGVFLLRQRCRRWDRVSGKRRQSPTAKILAGTSPRGFMFDNSRLR